MTQGRPRGAGRRCGLKRWIVVEKHGKEEQILLSVTCHEHGPHAQHSFTFKLDKLGPGWNRKEVARPAIK